MPGIRVELLPRLPAPRLEHFERGQRVVAGEPLLLGIELVSEVGERVDHADPVVGEGGGGHRGSYSPLLAKRLTG
jgi:hypothetical protein